MKKFVSAIASALIFTSAIPFLSMAHDGDLETVTDVLTDGSFNYELVDDTYTITKCVATIVTKVPAIQNGVPVTAIGDDAFLNCTGISELTIPETIKTIGESAFAGCSSLEKIELPRKLQSIGANAFAGCNSLTSLTIPEYVTEIPDYAFFRCDGLTEVNLPDSITKIGALSFYQCTRLEKLKLPKQLNEIGELAFGEMYSINEIDANNCANFVVEDGFLLNKDKTVIERAYTSLEGDVYIPDTVTEISSGAFSTCGGIINLFIPQSVTTIGYDAFKLCGNIKNIDFSEGLVIIKENAFMFNSSIESVSLPTTLTTIEKNAFAYCENLNKVVMPEGIKTIGEDAFLACDKLKEINVPKSITSIGNDAFGYTIENQARTKQSDFKMSVFSNSAGEKYSKDNGFESNVTDKSLKKMAFIIIAVGLLLAIIVFSIVLMSRSRKGASLSAKKAKKIADEKAEEENYEKIIED